MKEFIVSLLVVFSLVSCSSDPDNVIHKEFKEKSGWKYDSVLKKNVETYQTYYVIAPTWGQSVHLASERGDRLLKVSLYILIVIALVALVVGKYTNADWMPKVLDEKVFLYNGLLFVLLFVAEYLYFGDAYGIKWNNDKSVKKELYDASIKESGSTKPIWDSLRSNCLIVDGPYDCYEK